MNSSEKASQLVTDFAKAGVLRNGLGWLQSEARCAFFALSLRFLRAVPLFSASRLMLALPRAAVPIPRLAVPSYDWRNNVLHGLVDNGVSTQFPQAIGACSGRRRSVHGSGICALEGSVHARRRASFCAVDAGVSLVGNH